MSEIYNYGSTAEYLKAQRDTTNHKYGKLVYVVPKVIEAIYEYFKNDNIKNILCHGTRSGEEQQLFKKHFNCYVMGSELCEKAILAPMTTIWDFNKINEEWIGKYNLVYTNSFDHCITPKETLEVWKNQLAENGKLLIEWTDKQNGTARYTDPLKATEEEVVSWANEVGLELETKLLEKQAKHAGSVLVFKRNAL